MGFFCVTCGRKVRGQPVKHPCTRRKFGKNANRRIYDRSGKKRHRRPPPGYIRYACREFLENEGYCSRGSNCRYRHESARVCHDFRDYEDCSYGGSCRYFHVTPKVDCQDGFGCQNFNTCLKRHRASVSAASQTITRLRLASRRELATGRAACLRYLILGETETNADETLICLPVEDEDEEETAPSASDREGYCYWKPSPLCREYALSGDCSTYDTTCPYRHESNDARKVSDFGEEENSCHDNQRESLTRQGYERYCYWKPSPICQEFSNIGHCRFFNTTCPYRHVVVEEDSEEAASSVSSVDNDEDGEGPEDGMPSVIYTQGQVVSLKGDILENGKHNTAILTGFFPMDVNIREACGGARVRIHSTNEEGFVVGPFGKVGKCKVSFPDGISAEPGSTAELEFV